MPPPEDGNQYLPFADLMELEKINEVTYRSTALPFSPGGQAPGGVKRAYGGHVYAQAVWAAAQTVGEGFVVHNVTGFFLLGGLPSVPFIYKVHTLRNGRSYAIRIVNVTQREGSGICFTCTASFKTAETSPLDKQAAVDIPSAYESVLAGKRPEDFEEAPGMDVPWYWRRRKETGYNDPFPGLQARKVDMTAFNRGLDPLDKRQLIYYRALGKMPKDANLNACAHLYASDRNSLFIVANHFNAGDSYSQMGSLAHTVVFHVPLEEMFVGSDEAEDDKGREWFVKEDWTTRAAGGRGMFHSRVWDARGRHVATLMQEGMIRVKSKDDKEKL
ncbi:hypothetical protein MBLNU230_g0032t1 [Neophaeotheca triangularis]